MTPTATTAPQIPLGYDTAGTLLSVPAGRILLAGACGTGKTVLASRIARTTGEGALRWVIHERHRDHAYPDADQRATSRAEAARLLDAAFVLTPAGA
jgi:SpoVK/Ycf46/Vps4 family AAA+-type ATPase